MGLTPKYRLPRPRQEPEHNPWDFGIVLTICAAGAGLSLYFLLGGF